MDRDVMDDGRKVKALGGNVETFGRLKTVKVGGNVPIACSERLCALSNFSVSK
jgi:hypothetical protein